ncbi:MAG TPA: NAD(P)-dependent oxidoreductase [Anaerolineaceae bacterium]
MKVLLTGAFGNIGRSTLDALLARGHVVRTFDLPSRANLKAARKYAREVELAWGDLRDPQAVATAVQGVDAVIHLAFVIPNLSKTGVSSEARPDWARSINVGGTHVLIDALRAQGQHGKRSPRLIFASSLHVFGKTQHLPPPRTTADLPHPTDNYSQHKYEVEQMVRESGLEWSILRLGAALPIQLIFDRGMFQVPLDNRIEFVHTRDAGMAFANAVDTPPIIGQTLLIGGGPGCQLYYREMMARVLEAMGIGQLPDWAFSHEEYPTDWLDTTQSQAMLHFQVRTFEDYINDLRRALGGLRFWVVAARPLVRRWLLSKSPYHSSL